VGVHVGDGRAAVGAVAVGSGDGWRGLGVAAGAGLVGIVVGVELAADAGVAAGVRLVGIAVGVAVAVAALAPAFVPFRIATTNASCPIRVGYRRAGLLDVIPYVVSCAAMDLRSDLARLKQSRRSVRPGDLHALLCRAGFERRQGKGDHWVYSHPKRRFPLTIDPRNPLLPA
jgi:predicted RNA binding protein YcfA (HicA-like mRNA interferase family)